MAHFWIPIIIRHLIFRVPKIRGHNFDNHPIRGLGQSDGANKTSSFLSPKTCKTEKTEPHSVKDI